MVIFQLWSEGRDPMVVFQLWSDGCDPRVATLACKATSGTSNAHILAVLSPILDPKSAASSELHPLYFCGIKMRL